MDMKGHILAALEEQFDRWEELPGSLSEEQVTAPEFDYNWSIKDVRAHLWAWQQISIARMEAGWHDREPEFPDWIVESVENWEEDADRVDALIFERYHEKPWSEIHQTWKDEFLRFLDLGEKVSERDLLDGDRYLWLKGYSLAFILVASYEHHQEHLEKLLAWLKEQ